MEEYELKQAAIRLVETSPLYSKEKLSEMEMSNRECFM